MKYLFTFFAIILLYSQVWSQIKISETMPAPVLPEPEWVELYNLSADKIYLNEYSIGDCSSQKPFYDIEMLPNSFAVICKDTNIIKTLRKIPENTKLIQISLPSLNNDGDCLILKNNNETVDSVCYFKNQVQSSVSLQRSNYDSDSLYLCKDPSGSTIGRANSDTFSVQSIEKYDLTINEVMTNPAGNYSEFVEIVNTSTQVLNLYGLELIDAGNPAKPISLTIDKDLFVNPYDYALISWDSSIFNYFPNGECPCIVFVSSKKMNLSSSEEILILKYMNNLIDSIYINSKLHDSYYSETKGRSLEKISPISIGSEPDSWNSSTDFSGSTPCRANTSYIQYVPDSEITIKPNPANISNGEILAIEYKLPYKRAYIEMEIFDPNGILICKPINNALSSKTGTLYWDGKNNGSIVNTGAYIVVITAVNTSNGDTHILKTLTAIIGQ